MGLSGRGGEAEYAIMMIISSNPRKERNMNKVSKIIKVISNHFPYKS